MTAIETYRINGKWCARVYGAALVHTHKTRELAQKYGEWYLKSQWGDTRENDNPAPYQS
jgi:hypothetical protein